MSATEELQWFVEMFLAIDFRGEDEIAAVEEYYEERYRWLITESGYELQSAIDLFADNVDEEEPEWSCGRWGDHDHVWSECPECLYRLETLDAGENHICFDLCEAWTEDSDDPEDQGRI